MMNYSQFTNYPLPIKAYFISGICLLCIFFSSSIANASDTKRILPAEYIDNYKYEAINEMLEYNIPASITIAQGMLESDCGNSPLAKNAKNHFGIKCHVEWSGPTYIQDDDKKDECFRVYDDPKDSFRDHSLFLKDRPRYASLFQLNITDYKAWAHGLKQAGYATNPVYAEKLIKLIEENGLHKYDNVKNIQAVKHTVKETFKEKIIPETVVTEKPSMRHEIKLNNKVQYVIARPGDTYFGIATEFGIDIRILFHNNNLHKTDELKAGQYIYLKPKRARSEVKFYTVKPGDTMYSISQLYGVKLKKLYRKNNMQYGGKAIAVGDIISLQKRLTE